MDVNVFYVRFVSQAAHHSVTIYLKNFYTFFSRELFKFESFNIFNMLLFSPSTTNEKITNLDDFDFFEAEEKGKKLSVTEECAQIYRKCEKSLLEFVSDVEGLF